jgi:aspartate aminotransferase
MEMLSKLSSTLKGSQILFYSNAVKALQQKGHSVYNFTVGDFDTSVFPIPMELKKEMIQAYWEDYTAYPAAEGNADLRQAIAQFEHQWNGYDYVAEEVLVGSGGRPMIYAAFRTIVDKGEGIIYGLPNWNMNYYAQLVEGHSIEVETKAANGFLPVAEELEPYLKDAVLLCLCSPQNPTGTIFSGEQLKAICELVVKENERRGKSAKNLYLLFDAMYGALTVEGFSAPNPLLLCPSIRPYLIVINAVSKIFAATGLRVGWCLGPLAILQKMKNVLSHMGAWAPMAEQKAVARFLPQTKVIKGYFEIFKEQLAIRLNRLYQGIEEMRSAGYPVGAIQPCGGLYLSITIDLLGKTVNGKELETSEDVASYLLERSGIALLPFSVFGSASQLAWFRLSVGTCKEENIALVLQRFKEALKPLSISVCA